jgi:hypothetical protein
LDYITYLGTDEISFEFVEFCWDVKYKGKNVCYIKFGGFEDEKLNHWIIWSDQVPGSWTTWAEDGKAIEYMECPVDERIKEIAWANINVCGNCGGKCNPGKRKTVLGKEFDNLCQSAMVFTNPDKETLECVKKMADIRKKEILNE